MEVFREIEKGGAVAENGRGKTFIRNGGSQTPVKRRNSIKSVKKKGRRTAPWMGGKTNRGGMKEISQDKRWS